MGKSTVDSLEGKGGRIVYRYYLAEGLPSPICPILILSIELLLVLLAHTV